MPLSTTQLLSTPYKRKIKHKRTPIQVAFSALTRVSPYLAGRLATHLWYRTQHRCVTVEEQRVLEQASTEVRKFANKSVCIYRWGEGAPVVLAHGWNGNAAQMTFLVETLVDQGFQVTAFDAPGHGHSSGNTTDIIEISDVITQLLEESGEDTAVVAHSFGGMCAMHAVANGASVSSMVCISPPKDVTTLLQQFTNILGMNSAVTHQVRCRLEQRFGEAMWSKLSMQEWVRHADIPGLIIHDSRDRYIPLSNGRAVHTAWKKSELQITRGLGHMRILQNAEVITRIGRFLIKSNQ
ncbi:MAG: alpha/beta hydrolase [Candidatus Thiodiazotropha sp. (ex Ctena orbiculata)]|nr:alpha/beta hydrolase [Candidatus Thiodiazotropha taylori]